MARKKTRRPASKSSKKSWVDKIFSLKKIFVFGLVVTTAAFISKSNYEMQQVAGTSTTTAVYTKADLLKMAKANPSSVKIDKYVAVELWKDADGNRHINGSEGCLAKNYTFKLNGSSITKTQPSSCERLYFKVTQKCNTLTYVGTNTSNTYNFTGIEYHDSYNYYKTTKSKSIQVCGFPMATGGDFGGYVYNEVSFGVNSK